jgi:hypothetical protein
LAPAQEKDQPITKKVLLIIHNPFIESEGRTLNQVLKWKDPDSLARVCIEDIRECSGGYINFVIAERIEADEWPMLVDGYRYDDSTFLAQWKARKGFHQPEGVDYHELVRRFDIVRKIDEGLIDEVWDIAFPYGGYWESTMMGKNAIYCNSDPHNDIDSKRVFIYMGFNFERGVGEMLEDFGHRAESILEHVYGGWEANEKNDWNKFTLYDKNAPGKAQCGNVHFAPNSVKDYDWANKTVVDSYCDEWLDYPNMTGKKKKVDCKEWGCEIRAHHKWWFSHMPKIAGKKDGKWMNWWKYFMDYENAIKTQ